jgi:hypothetical protein
MTKLFKSTLTLLLFSIIVSSCNSEMERDVNELDLKAYSDLKNALAKDLVAINSKDPVELVENARSYYGDNSKQFNAFNTSMEGILISKNGRINSDIELNSFQKKEVENLVSDLDRFDNLDEYNSFLESKFDYYASQDLNIDDKNFILTFLSVYQVTLNFEMQNQAEFANGRTQGFWGCAAGIAGAVATTVVVVGAIVTPPLWVLAASEWYLVVSAGTASVVAIVEEC